MRRKVHVTEAHIHDGAPADCTACPVALALTQQLRLKHHRGIWSVTRHRLSIHDFSGATTSESWTCSTPRSVARFIRDFDSAFGNAAPFAFWVTVPDEYLAVTEASQ